MSVDVLGQLSEAGVSVWLDDISRGRLRTGDLQELVDGYHVTGVTSNPTIFAHAVDHGDAYDGQLADLKTRGVSVEEASRMITTYDIRWACDVLGPVYDATAGLDGRVSIEVDPRVAKDTHQTIAEARNLWWMVDRPNLFIKVPATPEGLPAIRQAISEGISVNVTLIFSLIFSLQRYGEVIDAYMAGLEQAKAAGRDVSQIRSVASFFVSRMDTEVDSGWTSWAAPRRPRCAAGRPPPTPGWPMSCSSSGSPGNDGSGCATAGRSSSGRCGPRPPPRTRRSPTPCTSPSSSSATR